MGVLDWGTHDSNYRNAGPGARIQRLSLNLWGTLPPQWIFRGGLITMLAFLGSRWPPSAASRGRTQPPAAA